MTMTFCKCYQIMFISTSIHTKVKPGSSVSVHRTRRTVTYVRRKNIITSQQQRKQNDFNRGPEDDKKNFEPWSLGTNSKTSVREKKDGQYNFKMNGNVDDERQLMNDVVTDDVNGDLKFPPGKLPFALELDYVLNHPIADAMIAALVSLNCLIFALQTIDVAPAFHEAFLAYEQNLSILFVMEYFCRWYGKGLSPRFLLTRGMIVDFIAVAPFGFAVADQSEALFVRLLRLSRILRIQRVVMDTDRSAEVMGSMTAIQVRLASIGLSLFSLLYVSAGLFYQVEKDVNPNILNFFDAFYYTTITLFTVGFGDVTALTSWGRTITVLTVLSGAVLVPYQLSELERVRQMSEKKKTDMEMEWYMRRATTTQSRQSSMSGNGKSPSSSVFISVNDADIECKRCFLKGHQTDARFCRNCGALLTKRRFD